MFFLFSFVFALGTSDPFLKTNNLTVSSVQSLIARGVEEADKGCIEHKMLKKITHNPIFKKSELIIKLQNFVNQKQSIIRIFFQIIFSLFYYFKYLENY